MKHIGMFFMIVGALMVVGSMEPEPWVPAWGIFSIAVAGCMAVAGGYHLWRIGGGERIIEPPWEETWRGR